MKLKELYESVISPNRNSYKKIKGPEFLLLLKPKQHLNGHNASGTPISSYLLSDEEILLPKGKKTTIGEYNFDKAKKIISAQGYSFPKNYTDDLGDEERKKILSALIVYSALLKQDENFFNKFGNKNALSDEIDNLKKTLNSSLNDCAFVKKGSNKEEEKTEETPTAPPKPPKTSKKGKKTTNLTPGNTDADMDDLEKIKKVKEDLGINTLIARKEGLIDAIKDIDKEIEEINDEISSGEENLKKADTDLRKKSIQKDIDEYKAKKAEKEKEKDKINKELKDIEEQKKAKEEEFNKIINQ